MYSGRKGVQPIEFVTFLVLSTLFGLLSLSFGMDPVFCVLITIGVLALLIMTMNYLNDAKFGLYLSFFPRSSDHR